MMPLRTLLPALVLLAATGSTSSGLARSAAPAPHGDECFNVRSVVDYSSAGRDAINVRVGGNRYYRLDILGTCPDIDLNFHLGLRSRSGSSWICHDTDAEVIARGPFGQPDRCPVVGMRQLSAEEVAAIRHPPRHRR